MNRLNHKGLLPRIYTKTTSLEICNNAFPKDPVVSPVSEFIDQDFYEGIIVAL
jgi:hypothetical protein